MLQVMLQERVIAEVLSSIDHVSGASMTAPLTLISRLVLASPAFAQQYLQADGLAAHTLKR